MYLDFIQPRRRSSLVGWLLLLLGLAALGAVLAWQFLDLQPKLASEEAALRQVQSELTAREPVSVHISDDQLSVEWLRAAKVAQELVAPWAPLFAILEGASSQSIAVLSLELDGARRELILTGEARNYAALLDYYRYLQSQKMLTAVALQTHQVSRQDRDKPVRFRITAHWEQAS